MNTMQQGWNSYAARVLTPMGIKPDSTQYVETRRAFYAGAWHLINLMLGPIADMSDEAGEATLSSLKNEMFQFYSNIGTAREGS